MCILCDGKSNGINEMDVSFRFTFVELWGTIFLWRYSSAGRALA